MFGLKKKTLVIGGVIAALLGTSAFAMKAHWGGDRSQHMIERVSKNLDLDASQKNAFFKMVSSYGDMRSDAPTFMLDMSGKVKALAADDTLTVEEVNELRDDIKAEFDRRVDVLVPEFVAFYNTLNDEQREIVTTKLEKMSDRFEHHLEKRAERAKQSAN